MLHLQLFKLTRDLINPNRTLITSWFLVRSHFTGHLFDPTKFAFRVHQMLEQMYFLTIIIFFFYVRWQTPKRVAGGRITRATIAWRLRRAPLAPSSREIGFFASIFNITTVGPWLYTRDITHQPNAYISFAIRPFDERWSSRRVGGSLPRRIDLASTRGVSLIINSQHYWDPYTAGSFRPYLKFASSKILKLESRIRRKLLSLVTIGNIAYII